MGGKDNTSGCTSTLIASILSFPSGRMQKKIEKDTSRVSVFHSKKAVALLYLDQSKTSPYTLKAVEGSTCGGSWSTEKGRKCSGEGDANEFIDPCATSDQRISQAPNHYTGEDKEGTDEWGSFFVNAIEGRA